MEADLDIQKPEEHKNTLDQEAVQFLKSQLAAFIEAKAEDTIIKILRENAPEEQEFVKRYLPYIYKAVHKAQLNNVIEFIELNFFTNLKDKIRCALKINDMNTVLELTNFKDHLTSYGVCLSEYEENLQKIGLEPIYLDRILCRFGVNLKDKPSGQRYLQMLLRRKTLDNKLKKLILKFISKLKKQINSKDNLYENTTCHEDSYAYDGRKEINHQDSVDQNTAFHEALYAYSRYKENKDIESMQNAEEIIKTLFLNGANPSLKNSHDISPSDFEYYCDRKEQWQAERLKILQAEISEFRNSLSSNVDKLLNETTKVDKELNETLAKKSNNSYKTLALTGIAIVGAAAIFYFGYTFLNKNTTNTGVKVK